MRGRIAAALRAHDPSVIPDDRCETRAAVALVLRPRGTPGDAELLFVQRVEDDRDPWSGHMAFPGGRRQSGDPHVLATALRETREETSLALEEPDVLGRLDEVHPLTRRLPSIAVTPFVAWYERAGRVRGNREVSDHVWVPLGVLADPAHRSTLRIPRGRGTVTFPTIEYGGYTIWGLTYEIVSGFRRVLDRGGTAAGGAG